MQSNNRQKGFTLLEVMVVIVILGSWPPWWCPI